MNSLYLQLQTALESDHRERVAASFLSKHPEIVWSRFHNISGHAHFVLAEFPFGSQFRCDLITLVGYSGAWEGHFIELEPVGDQLVLKNGTFSERIRIAIRQISDWRNYIRLNLDSFHRDLSAWAKDRDLLQRYGPCEHDPCTMAGDYLKDPETFLRQQFWIVAGRRDNISLDSRKRLNRLAHDNDIHFTTYDSFLDVAKEIDVRPHR